MTPRQIEALRHDWGVFGRDEQQLPDWGDDWEQWFIRAGRGWGKTRTGAEATREAIEEHGARRIALVGRTAADVRDVMIEGESGLLSVFPPSQTPIYEPSKRRVLFHNGAVAMAFSSEKPASLRGPQHDWAWADELPHWNKPQETWDNVKFGLRLGKRPRAVITGTLKPIKIVVELLKDRLTKQTTGATKDNAANLAASFMRDIYRKYGGTRLGLQELEGALLDDNPGALWHRGMFDEYRRPPIVWGPKWEKRASGLWAPNDDGVHAGTYDLKRVVVALDPATTSDEGSDETGIIVAGEGSDGHYYALADLTARDTPSNIAKRAVQAYDDYEADAVVAEVNNGGDWIEALLRTVRPKISYQKVHATRGKQVRAQPVAALYEQRRVWHARSLPALEDELCNWTPESGESPNRLDALVWALTYLAEPRAKNRIVAW